MKSITKKAMEYKIISQEEQTTEEKSDKFNSIKIKKTNSLNHKESILCLSRLGGCERSHVAGQACQAGQRTFRGVCRLKHSYHAQELL